MLTCFPALYQNELWCSSVARYRSHTMSRSWAANAYDTPLPSGVARVPLAIIGVWEFS